MYNYSMTVFSQRVTFRHIAVSAIVFVIFALPLFVSAQPAGLVKCTGWENCKFGTLIETIRAVIDWILTISAVIGGVLFAYAGFLYATSAGNTGQISKAHGIFGNVLVGITIAFAAWLIIKSILDAIGIKAGYSGIG